MSARHRATGLGVALAGSLLLGSPSQAHIDLLSPSPRASGKPDSYLNESPCGQRVTGRVAEKVSVFRPGETITVAWDVYVRHPSYFRIAFDLDGADSFSDRSSLPAEPERDDPGQLMAAEGELILDLVEDRAGQLGHVEREVTLPAEACDDCTLQLIQFTYGLPLRDATYYQCADIVLEGEVVEPLVVDAGEAPEVVNEEASPEAGCTLGGLARSKLPGSAGLAWLCLCWLRRRARMRRFGSARSVAARLW